MIISKDKLRSSMQHRSKAMDRFLMLVFLSMVAGYFSISNFRYSWSCGKSQQQQRAMSALRASVAAVQNAASGAVYGTGGSGQRDLSTTYKEEQREVQGSSQSANLTGNQQQQQQQEQQQVGGEQPTTPRVPDLESVPEFLKDTDAAFGGCLMLMDDNHFLAEWLAYHWFVLPLRHLVVYIDPKSTTSPLPILERFKDYISFEVVDWTYEDAYSPPPEGSEGTIHADPKNRKLVGKQLAYYEDCIKWYKQKDWKSWITLHDPDEFVSINPIARDQESMLYFPDIPQNTEPGSVMKYLQRFAEKKFIEEHHRLHCIGVPRMQFCTEDKEPDSFMSTPLGLQDKDFLSLRWSSFPKGKKGVRAPKNFVYIGDIEQEYIEQLDLFSNNARPHEVLPDRCLQYQRREGSPFQIYHYSGTPEQRQFRKDPRGQFGNRPGSPPADDCGPPKDRIYAHDIKPWVTSFIEQVGSDEATKLLDGVGEIHGWPEYTGHSYQTLGAPLGVAAIQRE